MKTITQRTLSASVTVNNIKIANINHGILVLLGIHKNDTEQKSDLMIKKILNLHIFSDDNNLMNKNIMETNGEILLVSQFTLYEDYSKGNRPSFTEAMPSINAKIFYNNFAQKIKTIFPKVKTGEFATD